MNGADLARAFHAEVVAPLLARHAPGVPVAAGRLGAGSDVLGHDDATSRDHDWGCRLTLLTDDPAPDLDRLLDTHLPEAFAGHPVRFALSGDPRVRHRVEVATVAGFARGRLGVDATRPLTPAGWLGLTGQAVLEVTAGPVFADATAGLGPVRSRLAWYPDDVWCHVLAAAWMPVEQRLPFVGRTATRGDDLGSRVLAARLVDDVVTLAFGVSRTWAPYDKWRGTAFARLPVAASAAGPLAAVLAADGWREREAGLCRALDAVLAAQRAAGLPGPTAATSPFHARPFRTVDPAVPAALRAAVADPAVRALPADLGPADQWIDHVPLRTDPRRRAAVARAALGPVPEAT